MMLLKLPLRHSLVFLSFASALAVAPAAAACLEEVAALERRIDKMVSDDAKAPQKMRVAPGASENWFGSPASLEGAREQLHNARMMGEDGDEDGCRSHLDQARRIVDGVPR